LSNNNKPILLYDGVCNICNASVQFVLANEKNTDIAFVSLQSEMGRSLLRTHNLPENYTESLIFIVKEKAYTHSDAALHIAEYLKAPYYFLKIGFLLPKVFRDYIYNYIAKNRYKWFGKNESCMLPDPNLRHRFLDFHP